MRVLRLASLMSALEPTTRRSAGALRRLAGGDGDDAPAKLADALRSERWRVDEIEACKDASGKGPLHFAAWRGAPQNCEILIDAGCDVEAPATGEFSYGKTPLFFAVTRCRDATVLALLERGAATKIVNNKGQSVRALARSHLKSETYAAIVAAEREPYEAAVREALQIGASENMRVRVLSRAEDKALAALELEPSRVKMDDEVFDALSATLGKHGLWLSDVRAFESGSVAKRLEDDEIAKPAEWTSLFVHFRRPAVRSANDGGDLLERWEAEQCEIARAGGDGFVVSFGTTWCGPCHVLEPELETLARFVWDFDDSVAVAKLDAEASRAETELAGRLGVDAYPTTIWMRGGVEVHRVEGALPAAALVQLTALHLMDAESTEVMRAERPEMFAPVPLEPF